jgi:hypothetical protein
MITIAITNESTAVSDADVQACMAALQAQVDNDFGPAYDLNKVSLVWLPKGSPVPIGTWQLVFADNSDQAGALGYHETTENGDPIGFAFVADDIADGTSWTVTASHELLEMLGDPDIQTCETQDLSDGSSVLRMKEVCDVCEDDSLGYYPKKDAAGNLFMLSNGKPVDASDFVLPAYWNQNAPAGSKFDFLGHVTAPLQILPGGYIGELQIPASVAWQQVTPRMLPSNIVPGTLVPGEIIPGGKAIKPFNRRARRAIPDAKWQRSSPRHA